MNAKKSKYIYAGLTALAVLAASLILVFAIFRRKELANGVSAFLKILEPFFIGSVIAYLLAPLCNRLEKIFDKILPKKINTEKSKQGLSVFVSTLVAIAVIAVLIGLIVPNTLKSLVSLVLAIPDYIMNFVDWASEKLTDYPEVKKYLLNLVDIVYEKVDTWTQSYLMPSIQTLINGVGTSLTWLINFMVNFLVGFIISIYLLYSRRTFARQAKMVVYACFKPKYADAICDEMHYADKMFSGFLRGKVLDSAIVGMICFIVTKFMGIEDAVLISVIVGVTNIIPFFGPFIGAVPSAMIIFVTDPKKCVYFIIFVVILQQFDGNVLGPKCMGSNINLSAFWVLFAVLLFGGLFGFVGMIIGVPLFAVIYDICKKLIYYLLEKHGKSGMIPLTGQPELQEIYMGKDGESKTKNTPEEPTSPDSGADKATP